MRLKGKLKSWNDDRGFGFIDPIQGGEEVFVHIKAFRPRSERPQVDELLWFEIEFGPQGKKRATNVELVRRTDYRSRTHRESSTKPGSATLLAIPFFALLYIIIEFLWEPPLVLAAIYVVASSITFLTYAGDKLAAKRGARRTQENTLHLLAFVGGWPGGLLAQQFLRHKSRKAEFQSVFWVTVVLNVVGFIVFCSPIGQQLWAAAQ